MRVNIRIATSHATLIVYKLSVQDIIRECQAQETVLLENSMYITRNKRKYNNIVLCKQILFA